MKEKELLELVVKSCRWKRAEDIVAGCSKLDQRDGLLCYRKLYEQPSVGGDRRKYSRKIVEAGGNASHVEGDSAGGWVLLDLGSVVVHVFSEEMRAHYNLKSYGTKQVLSIFQQP